MIVDEYILNAIEWNMEQERTKKFLKETNNELLYEIGRRLPKNQIIDFLKQYSSRLDKQRIYNIAVEIPPNRLLEFFKLKILESEVYIGLLARQLPKEDLIEFFNMNFLRNYEDDIVEIATNLDPKDVIEFFKMGLLKNKKNIVELAKKLPPNDILQFLEMKLLYVKDEKEIAKLAEKLPPEEFLQFWKLELVHDLELLKPIIERIPDTYLDSYIKSIDNYALKELLLEAIKDKNISTRIRASLDQERKNAELLESMQNFAQTATPAQLEQMGLIFSNISKGNPKKEKQGHK